MPEEHQEPEWDTTQAEEQLQQDTPDSPPPVEEDKPSRAVLEYFQSRGYDPSSYESDEQFLEDLESGYAEVNRYRGTIGEYEAHRDEFEQWRQSRGEQEPIQETPAPEPEKPRYAPPPVSDTARQLLQSGMVRPDTTTGMFKATDATFQRFADELTKEAQWRRAQAEKLINSPESWLEETGVFEKFKPQELNRDELKQELLNEIKQELAAQRQEATVAQEFNQHLPALYQMQNGQVIKNALGEPIPTELGQQFNQALAQAEAYGIQDKQTKIRFAMDQIRPRLEQQTQQEEQPTPQERRQTQQETFVERARRDGQKRERLTSRHASIAEEAAREATQNDYVNDDELWRRAKQDAEAQLN